MRVGGGSRSDMRSANLWCIFSWALVAHLAVQLGRVSSPRDAACCFARSLRFSILVVLLFRLGRELEACRMGEDQTC